MWLSEIPAEVTGTDSGKGRYRIFTAENYKADLRLLLFNSFITFGDTVFRQLLGIPMGTNAAPFIANYYLLAYELQFCLRLQKASMKRLPVPGATAQRQHIKRHLHEPNLVNWARRDITGGDIARALLAEFRLTKQFLDDLLSINNRILDKMLYTSQTYLGFPGIYPDALNLTTAGEGQTQVPYMDILFVREEHGDKVNLVTLLYDKRRRPDLAALGLIKFPSISSALSRQCKGNILTSQFHRYVGIITDRHNLLYELAQRMMELHLKGYDMNTAISKLAKLVHQRRDMLPGKDRRAVVVIILGRLAFKLKNIITAPDAAPRHADVLAIVRQRRSKFAGAGSGS